MTTVKEVINNLVGNVTLYSSEYDKGRGVVSSVIHLRLLVILLDGSCHHICMKIHICLGSWTKRHFACL